MANATAAPVTQPTIITHDETAWRAGFIAGNLGRATPCPYPPASIEALAWTSGKIEGAAKPRGTVPQLRPMKKPHP